MTGENQFISFGQIRLHEYIPFPNWPLSFAMINFMQQISIDSLPAVMWFSLSGLCTIHSSVKSESNLILIVISRCQLLGGTYQGGDFPSLSKPP